MAIQYGKSAGSELFCFEQNRWRRRSILPWRMPSTADYSAPASTSSDGREAKQASKIEAAVPSDLSVWEAAPHPLSPAELHSLYAGTTVPPHRYLAPALIAALYSPSIALDPAKWFTDIENVDLAYVAGAWLRTNSDCIFEQLKCVGLDPQTSQLTAVLTIKQERGYAGGPSTAGSQEFVAFWVDWGSGFQYEGTASVVVHDYGSLPASGLEIHIGLPVDFSLHTPAESPAITTIKVRAVLSWNTPPSITHPYAQVVWGNSLDLSIVIAPHPAVHSGKESFFLSGPRRGNFAFTSNADDLEDRGPSFTRNRWDLVDPIRDSASY